MIVTSRTLASTLRHVLWLGASAAVVLACSSAGERTPFTNQLNAEIPEEPTDEEEPSSPSSPSNTPPDPGEPEPDNCARAAPSNKCGVAPQCGCSATETCDVRDTQGNVACVAAGKAPMGHACTATVGCQKGLTCVFGTCHAFCGKAGDACTQPGTGACSQVTAQGGAAIANLTVCRVKCDPRDKASCGGATKAGVGVCMVDNDGNTDCREGGTRTENQTCNPQADCGPGLVCIVSGGGSDGTCKRWCRVGQPDCGGAQLCRAFQTALMVDGVEHGACP